MLQGILNLRPRHKFSERQNPITIGRQGSTHPEAALEDHFRCDYDEENGTDQGV